MTLRLQLDLQLTFFQGDILIDNQLHTRMQHFYHAKRKFWQGHCDNAEINWGRLCIVVNTKWAVRSTVWLRLDQYATTPNTLDRPLDLCFGNVPRGFVSKPRPPLGLCNRKIILLLPKYWQKRKPKEHNQKRGNFGAIHSKESTRRCVSIAQWCCCQDKRETFTCWRWGDLRWRWHGYATTPTIWTSIWTQSYQQNTSTYSRLSSLRGQKTWNYVHTRTTGNAREACKGLTTMMGRTETLTPIHSAIFAKDSNV